MGTGTSSIGGGAIYIEGGATLNIVGSIDVINNTVQTKDGVGGAFFVLKSRLKIDGASSVSNNSAKGPGGGIYLGPAASARLRHVRILGNTATSGAGIYLLGAANVTLDNVTVAGNHAATNGGGIASPELGRINMTDCTIANNTVSRNTLQWPCSGPCYLAAATYFSCRP